MQRRHFIKSTAALIGTSPLININQSYLPFMNGEVFKTKIGTFNCFIFRDLMFKYLAKDFFINAAQNEVDVLLQKYKTVPENIPSPFIALLLKRDDKIILVDTGMGYIEEPVVFRGNSYQFKGRLHQLLQQENIRKEAITDVIITHFHPDHIGGIFTEKGQVQFPNARFHMHEHEWHYWHSPQSDNQPPLFRWFIEKNITRLKDGNLSLIKGDFIELVPGITSVKADGHTPGQIALDIQSEKEHLLYISDAFLHPLHIEKLDWQTNYDLDHQKAKQTRIKLLDLAYRDNKLINAFHFDFPGLGQVNKVKNNWIWNYANK